MDVAAAVQGVKKDLEATFGNTLAASIVAIARMKANAPLVGMTKEHYINLVSAIAGDDRVKSMLGAAGAQEKLLRWKKFVD